MAKLLQQETERIPIPDPTELTTEALKLSIANLKEFVMEKIEGTKELLQAEIGFTNTLKEEKFHELHEQLRAVESHRVEAKADNAKAIDAALAASENLFKQINKCNEEAASKSETSFTKQIEAIRKEGQIERDGLASRLDGLKERMDRGGGREEKQTEDRRENRQVQGWLIPVLILGGLSVINLIINFVQMAGR